MKEFSFQVERTEASRRRSTASCGKDWSVLGRSFGRCGGFLLVLVMLAISCLILPPPAMTSDMPELDETLESHKAGRLQEAIDGYTEVLKKQPQSPEALNWRGMAYDDLGQYDKALEDLNQAIQLSPNYADAYNNRGEVYRKMKKFREAMADYRKAFTLEKGFAEAHYNLGLVLEHIEKNPMQAAQEYERYLSLKPNAPDKEEIVKKVASLKAAAATAPPRRPAGVKPPGAAPPGAKPGQPPVAVKPPTEKPPVPTGPPGPPQAGPPKPKKFQPGFAPKPVAPMMPQPGIPGGIPGSPEQMQTWLMQFVLPMVMAGLLYLVIGLVIYIVITSLSYFIIANKTGTSGAWMAFVPVLDKILKARIAGKGTLMMILFLLGDPVILTVISVVLLMGAAVVPPLVIAGMIVPNVLFLIALVVWIPICVGIAAARGKAAFWGLLICIPLILVIVLSGVLAVAAPSLVQDLNMVLTALFGLAVLTWLCVPYYLALSR